MLLDKEKKNQIPVYYSCLLSAFELVLPEPPKPGTPETSTDEPTWKKKTAFDDLKKQTSAKKDHFNLANTSLQGNLLRNQKFKRNSMAASFSASDGKSFMSRIGRIVNLKKISGHILQLLQMGNKKEDIKTEISKILYYKPLYLFFY